MLVAMMDVFYIMIVFNLAERRPAILMSPPCLESQGLSVWSHFSVSPLLFLPSLVALSVLSFLLLVHSPDQFGTYIS